MAPKLSEERLKEALEGGASELAHIAGPVQPLGALVAFDAKSEKKLYASVNCETIAAHWAISLFRKTFSDVFGRDVVQSPAVSARLNGMGTSS